MSVDRTRKCEVCGGFFVQTRRGRQVVRTCGGECRRRLLSMVAVEAWARKVPRGPNARACVSCGRSFVPSQDRVVSCSRSCGNKVRWRRWREDRAIFHGIVV